MKKYELLFNIYKNTTKYVRQKILPKAHLLPL